MTAKLINIEGSKIKMELTLELSRSMLETEVNNALTSFVLALMPLPFHFLKNDRILLARHDSFCLCSVN